MFKGQGETFLQLIWFAKHVLFCRCACIRLLW